MDAPKGILDQKQNQQHKEWVIIETLGNIETKKKHKAMINNSRTRVALKKAQR